MYQPNYLELDHKLKEAIAWCDRHPDTAAATYRVSLTRTLDRFTQVTRETDSLYTHWRQLLGRQLTAGKSARLAWDRTAALADEHGYDDFPRRRIDYLEESLLVLKLEETIAWLKQRVGEWAWLEERAQELTRWLGEFQRNRKETEGVYRQYTEVIKRRVDAYDAAVAMVKEFVRDVRLSGGSNEEVRRFDIAFQ